MGDKDLTLWLRLRDDATKGLKALLPSLKQVGFAVGVAAAAGTALSIASFNNFQTSLNNVKAVSQATVVEMALFEAQALSMGASTKFSAQEAADAQAFLAMAGLSVQQSLAALPGTLQLAAAGQLDLARAADLTTNVMSGYRMSVSDIPRINDVLASTAATANTNVEQMGDAMSYVAPVAAAAGVQFEQTSAALGILASNAMAGERGGTALRGIIATLITPSAALESITGKYALTLQDATGAMLPLDEILGQFNEKGVSSGEIMSIFGKRAGPAMLALLATGSGALKRYTRDLEDVDGAAERMAVTQQEGIVGSMTNMASAASTLSIIIGKELGPAFIVFAELATERMRGLGENIGDVVRAAKAIAIGIASAFSVASLAYLALNAQLVAVTIATNAAKVAMITFNFVANLNPYVALATAIGLVVASYVYWKDEIIAFLSGAWSKFISGLQTGYNWLARLVPGMEEVSVAGMDTSESIGVLSGELELCEPLAVDLSGSLAGGAPGSSVAPSADEAAESLTALREETARLMGVQEAALLVTDLQWASYQKLWEIGTPVTDMLVSQNLALDGIAGVIPGVTSQYADLSGGISQSGDAVEEQEGTWASFGNKIGAALSSAGGAVGSFVVSTVQALKEGGPIAAAITIAIAAFNWFAGKVDEFMNGAAMAFNDASDSIVASLDKVTDGSLTAYEAFDRAFRWEGNEAGYDRLRTLQDLWVEAGLTAEAATAWQVRYNEAVATQDHASILRLLGELEEVGEAARLAGEAQVEAARLAAEAQERLDKAISATISAYFRAKDAGVKAYDEVFEAAIASGATQEEATARAEKAQIRAAAKVLREERKKYIQLARFEAILAAIRSGNAEGAVAAGNKAAREVGQAWDLSIGQVVTADNLATGDRVANATTVADHSIDESNRATDAIVDDIESIPTTRTVDIEYRGSRTGAHGGVDGDGAQGRQHGGPVSAGLPYVVGEVGPEIFTPSRSGSVTANKSIPTAEEIGVAVAQAMRRAPLVVPRDAVTDTVLGNSPSRRALAGFN